jgi:hypothetical protein
MANLFGRLLDANDPGHTGRRFERARGICRSSEGTSTTAAQRLKPGAGTCEPAEAIGAGCVSAAFGGG